MQSAWTCHYYVSQGAMSLSEGGSALQMKKVELGRWACSQPTEGGMAGWGLGEGRTRLVYWVRAFCFPKLFYGACFHQARSVRPAESHKMMVVMEGVGGPGDEVTGSDPAGVRRPRPASPSSLR